MPEKPKEVRAIDLGPDDEYRKELVAELRAEGVAVVEAPMGRLPDPPEIRAKTQADVIIAEGVRLAHEARRAYEDLQTRLILELAERQRHEARARALRDALEQARWMTDSYEERNRTDRAELCAHPGRDLSDAQALAAAREIITRALEAP